ncbi:MAG: hypothetical protein GY858_00530 [Candidatus Omnitrophica bacterium]|nr:hypothetical protein [Candidatus Omnitrophota bacterium]
MDQVSINSGELQSDPVTMLSEYKQRKTEIDSTGESLIQDKTFKWIKHRIPSKGLHAMDYMIFYNNKVCFINIAYSNKLDSYDGFDLILHKIDLLW